MQEAKDAVRCGFFSPVKILEKVPTPRRIRRASSSLCDSDEVTASTVRFEFVSDAPDKSAG
jgi:hypothetical protein